MSDAHSTIVAGLSPFAYLKLDEASGDVAADASGNDRNGEYFGTYTLDQAGIVPHGPAKCVSANNGDATIRDAAMAGITPNIAAFTVNIWVQYSGTGLTQVPVNIRPNGSNDGLCVGIVNRNAVGRVSFITRVTDELITGDLGINDGQPHMLTFWLDGTSQKIYVDAVERASRTAVRSTLSATCFAKFGRNSAGENSSYNSGQGFVGKMSAPAIFDRALTPAEITELYENAATIFQLFGTVRDKTGALASGRGVKVIRESDQECVAQVTTDVNGEYAVTVPNEAHTLVFTGEPDRNALVFAGVMPATPP